MRLTELARLLGSCMLLTVSPGCERVSRLFDDSGAAPTSAATTAPSASASAGRAAPSAVSEADVAVLSQPQVGRPRAVPLPLMVMPLGSPPSSAALNGVDLLPPDAFDAEGPRAALGPAPSRLGRVLEQGPVPPPSTKPYPQNVADKPIPRIGAQPWMIAPEWEARHNQQLEAPGRAQAKVVFLGDSITDGWRQSPSYKAHFSAYSPLNLGIHGDFTQNLLWRIEHGALDGLSPKAVVVMIGVNNLGGGFSVESTVSGVRAVLAAVKSKLSGVPIVLLTILPAGESPDAKLRQKINEANQQITKLGGDGVTVQEFGQLLLESDGTLSKSILRDFLHPTEAGYVRLGDALAPVLKGIVG